MLGNDFLDRHRAGHGRPRPQQGAGRPQGETGGMPQGGQQGRAHAALDDEAVETRQMLLFLRRHLGDRRGARAAAEDRELAGVDPRGAVFAGVIDPDHARDELLGAQVAGQAVVGGALRRHSVGVSRSRAAAPIRVIAAIVAA